jgi:hypothetical protein
MEPDEAALKNISFNQLDLFAGRGVPEDISWQYRQHIADHSTTWHNFYQNRTYYMRSELIAF